MTLRQVLFLVTYLVATAALTSEALSLTPQGRRVGMRAVHLDQRLMIEKSLGVHIVD
jgi:hypothetical protein